MVGELDGDGRADVVATAWHHEPDRNWLSLERYDFDPISRQFVVDPAWGAQLHEVGVGMMRSCDVTGVHGRELVMSGTLSLFGHNLFAGELGDPGFTLPGISGPFSCANLDGDARDEVIVNREVAGGAAIQVVDGGEVVWSSHTDLAEPLRIVAGAVEAADGDGDIDVVIGQTDQGEVPGAVLVLWNQQSQAGKILAFTHQVTGDLHPAYDTRSAQALHLPPPSP